MKENLAPYFNDQNSFIPKKIILNVIDWSIQVELILKFQNKIIAKKCTLSIYYRHFHLDFLFILIIKTNWRIHMKLLCNFSRAQSMKNLLLVKKQPFMKIISNLLVWRRKKSVNKFYCFFPVVVIISKKRSFLNYRLFLFIII